MTTTTKTYKIVRFNFDGPPQDIGEGGLTLAEAQEWCRRDDTSTHGWGSRDDWFDGYEEEED